MSEKMSVDKQDPAKDHHESDESMDSSPEAETHPATANATAANASNGNSTGGAPQEPQLPKRKGGRKPVRITKCQPPAYQNPFANKIRRFTQHQKRGSRETVKPRLLSGNAAPSTSSNSKRLSALMSKTWRTSRLPTGMPPMSA